MSKRLELAYALADFAHEGQLRKDGKTPFFYHPWNVAQAVKHLGEDYEITAILHDVPEDTDISLFTLLHLFGDTIADAIGSVTKKPKGFETYMQFVTRSKSNPIGRQVKIADIKHNLSTINGIDNEEEKQHLITKWTKALRFLEED